MVHEGFSCLKAEESSRWDPERRWQRPVRVWSWDADVGTRVGLLALLRAQGKCPHWVPPHASPGLPRSERAHGVWEPSGLIRYLPPKGLRRTGFRSGWGVDRFRCGPWPEARQSPLHLQYRSGHPADGSLKHVRPRVPLKTSFTQLTF